MSKEKKEMKEAINTLVEESTLTKKFLIFTAVSTMIATLGIVMNNVTILIGAMLIAPLLIPVISLSIGVGSGSLSLITHSLKALTLGLVIAVLCSMLVSWIFLYEAPNQELFETFSNSYTYSLVAFLAGIVGVYSWLKPNSGQILPGVTIAVALIPPVAFAGTVVVHMDQTMLIDTLQLILINLIGIFLGGLFTFLLYALLSKRPTLEVDKQVDSEVEKTTK